MKVESVVNYLVDWLRVKVKDAGASGVVLGVSGGIDSAVAAAIAKIAFPKDCMALLLPCHSQVEDLIHAQKLVQEFNMQHRIVNLDNAYNLISTQFASYIRLEGAEDRLLRANIKPRLRMLTLYYSAQARNYLVLGTSNKSEIAVGYCTKYGDNGVDLQLLGDLFKSEVVAIAHYLKVPEEIINKPPSGGLWMGQTDEDEMGFSYDDLERYLKGKKEGIENVQRIETMIRVSEHKRKTPEIAIIPDSL